MPDKKENESQTRQESSEVLREPKEPNQKEKTSSWGVIILLLIFFWPIGLFLLIRKLTIDNDIKLNKKTKKLLLVIAIILCIASTIIGVITSQVLKAQREADIASYSLNLDDNNGEITANCDIVDGSRNCKQIKISGTYTSGSSSHYVPISDSGNTEVVLKGDNGFYLLFNTTLEKSSDDIGRKSVKVCFGSSSISHYCYSDYPTYNLIINIIVTDEDRQKVKALEDAEAEEKQKAEEAEKKKQEEENAAKKAAEDEARRQEEASKKQQSNNSTNSSSSSSGSNSSSGNSSSSNSSQRYLLKTINEGETCPSNVKFCHISGNSTGSPKYGWGTMRGKIINNSGKNYSYLQITADVYNSAGSKIGDCWGNTSGLEAGATWEFEAYCSGWDYGVSLKNADISGW